MTLLKPSFAWNVSKTASAHPQFASTKSLGCTSPLSTRVPFGGVANLRYILTELCHQVYGKLANKRNDMKVEERHPLHHQHECERPIPLVLWAQVGTESSKARQAAKAEAGGDRREDPHQQDAMAESLRL